MYKRYVIILIASLIFLISLTGYYISHLDTMNLINFKDIENKSIQKEYSIVIEVDLKKLSIIDRSDGSTIKTYPIATGKTNSPTPLGSFIIIEKAHWGEGFGSRWMGLNVPWGKYGIHGTNNPSSIGANLSAGCIRMRNSDIEQLYDLVKKGSSVVISNGIYGPFGNGFRTLRPGDRGADVLEVQKRLFIKDYYKGSLDGIYGENMKKSLISFLKDNKIQLTDRINEEIYNELDIYLMD